MSKTQRELKALRQAQREEAARRQHARDRRNLIVIASGIGLALVVILGVALYLRNQEPHRLSFVAQTGTAGVQVPDEGRAHVPSSQPIEYKNYPPTSGPHYAQPDGPANWQTIGPLREGTFVHNLEHGGIVILYNCPSGPNCDTLKKQLENYVRNLAPNEPSFGEVKIVMSPYPRMDHKIALLAWDWIDQFDTYDQDRITRFYEVHVDQGPEKIP